MPIETSKETEDAKKAREAKEKKDRDDQDQAAKDKKKGEVTVQNSWTGFIKSLFTYFVLTLIFGLFGSSFIYLTSRGSELDEIFPTDEMFYSAKSYEILKHGPENIVDCKETSTGSFMGMEDNFPYNLIKIKGDASKEDLAKLTLADRLMNWFAKTVAGCFKSNRAILKGFLDNFSPDGPLGNHVFQIYFVMPFTIIVGGFISLITGFFSAFGSAVSADTKVTVWGGFLLYAWGLGFGLALIILMRLLGTIMFFPMSQNWKEVANIMACNVKPLVVLFGFFVCGAAYDTLDPSIAGVMGVVYLALVGWTVFRYFSKQLF
jgi:hypothetical protein